MNINYNNPAERNFYDIKQQFVDFLNDNNLTLSIDEDEKYIRVYNDTDCLAIFTVKQLAHRVKI